MITGTLREPENWVRDYRDLDQFKRYLDETCDHKDLNEVFPDMQTTAERLAQKFYFWCKARWAETYSVSVSETEKTWASFKEDKRAA
jgi:6-pyruvoyltetrahydropterin/6-carboxytetrahydropterin synthase